jgi:hypothetical protein
VKRETILLAIGMAAGGGGFWIGGAVKHRLPPSQPLTASEVTATQRSGGHWRVQELLTSDDACEVMLIERRFKDDVLDRIVQASPISSDPMNVGGGIARSSLPRGQRVAWAEYDIATSGVQRGIYSVVVTLAGCESGFSGTYTLIPAVPYDFTGLDLVQPTAPTSPR